MSHWNKLPTDLQTRIGDIVTAMDMEDHKEKYTKVLIEMSPIAIEKLRNAVGNFLADVYHNAVDERGLTPEQIKNKPYWETAKQAAKDFVDGVRCLPPGSFAGWEFDDVSFDNYPTDDQLAEHMAEFSWCIM